MSIVSPPPLVAPKMTSEIASSFIFRSETRRGYSSMRDNHDPYFWHPGEGVLTSDCDASREPFFQLCPPPLSAMCPQRDGQRPPLSDDHDEALAARDGGVDEVSRKHSVMLRCQRDDDSGIFRALGFVDRRRIGGNQRVELAETIFDLAPPDMTRVTRIMSPETKRSRQMRRSSPPTRIDARNRTCGSSSQ